MSGLFGGGASPRPTFIYGNIVFGSSLEDAWAVYRLGGQSYAGLATTRKVEVMGQLHGLVQRIEADFQILRIARRFSLTDYAESTWRTFDRRNGGEEEIRRREAGFRELLETHVSALTGRETVRPEVFLAIRLEGVSGGFLGSLGNGGLAPVLRRLGGAVGISDPRGLRYSQLTELERNERGLHERVLDYVDAKRARASEIVWLVRHAYVRDLGDPAIDDNFRPQALAIANEEGEEVGFQPAQWDLLRLHADHRVRIASRHLEIESESGTSRQAMLVCGSLPDQREFPGAEAELMFAPLDVEFPVDSCLSCEYLPNREAQRLARKRMVDADQMWREESTGDHGPSPDAEDRPAEARALQRRLGDNDHPPLLRSALTYIVSSAVSEEQLEERIERLRSEVGQRIELHRPIGAQHQVFLGALPGQSFPLAAYREHLLPEEVAAMVPTAVSHAGSEIGPYIGYTLTASRQPIRHDCAEASQTDRPPPMLITGAQGSGKTHLIELLQYHAFLQGSGPIVHVAGPKGTPDNPDHKLHQVPEVAAETERIVLSPEDRYQGLIDPLRVAEQAVRGDVAFSFVLDVLPAPVPPPWQTELRAAIEVVTSDPDRPQVLGSVADVLESGNEAAQEAGRALRVHAGSGLAKLAFGLPGSPVPEVGAKRFISFEIKNLTLPKPGTARSEMMAEERLGVSLLRLIAAYAMRLCASNSDRHSLMCLDEAWVLFDTSVGRSLLDQAARLSRSQFMSVILASQLVVDAEMIEGLVGAVFCGGVETEAEAERSLKLQRQDPDDESLVRRQLGFRKGRFLFRDINGQSVAMQVDFCDPALLAALSTTPRAVWEVDSEEAGADVAA